MNDSVDSQTDAGGYQVSSPDPYIETFTGRKFYPTAPCGTDVCIEDIAHALAMKCRFTGQSRFFYSVAEHSILLARWAAAEGRSRDVVAWCLMHDAAEAYLPDVARPIKPRLSGFKELERNVLAVIAGVFGLPTPVPEVVGLLDTRILRAEAYHLMPSRGDRWHITARELRTSFHWWAPSVAEIQFLETFEALEIGR